MADNFYGSLSVPETMLNESLKEAFKEEFSENPENHGGMLFYQSGCASNGRFDEIEEMLIEANIPFDRYSNAYCEYEAETRYYRPATKTEPAIDKTVTETHSGYSYVTTDKLKPLLQMEPAEALKKLDELIKDSDPYIIPLEEFCKMVTEESTGNEGGDKIE